jgi:hypothetical protein
MVNEGDGEAVFVWFRMAPDVINCYCSSGFGLPPVGGEDQRLEFTAVPILGLFVSSSLLLFIWVVRSTSRRKGWFCNPLLVTMIQPFLLSVASVINRHILSVEPVN